MEQTINILYLINLFGVLNGFILALYLLSYGLGLSNKLMGFLILILSGGIFSFFSFKSGGYLSESIVFLLLTLLGPTLNLFIKARLNRKYKLKSFELIHLIFPFSIFILYGVFQPENLKPEYYNLIVYMVLFQFGFYSVSALMAYLRRSKRIRYNVLILLVLFVFIWLAFSYHYIYKSSIFLPGFFALLIILYISVVFAFDRYINTRSTIKYKNKYLQEKERERILSGIEMQMERKVYLNPNLNLKNLAAFIDTNPVFLSQVIKENFNTHFNDFINAYRIEEAKKLLKSVGDKEVRLPWIALKSGFNTSSAFNLSFRKHTGLHPKTFLSSLK